MVQPSGANEPAFMLLPPPSAFASLSPREARAVLFLAAVVTGCLFMVSLVLDTSPRQVPSVPDDPIAGHDVKLFRLAAEHYHDGENYYDGMGREMRAHRFPTGSPFNYRLPTYAMIVGGPWGPGGATLLLYALGLAMVLMGTISDVRNAGLLVALPTFYLLAQFASWVQAENALVQPEYWAGLLIGISAAAYGLRLPSVAIFTGVLAVFFRELAVPYCLACATVALLERRRGEVIGWAVGLGLFGLFLMWHIQQVHERMLASDTRGQISDWLCMDGLRLVLATAHMNPGLMQLGELSIPGPIVALGLAMSLIGIAGWATPQCRRIGLAMVVYIVAFCFVGNPFNHYWGMMYATLLPYGVGRAPFVIRDLVRAAKG